MRNWCFKTSFCLIYKRVNFFWLQVREEIRHFFRSLLPNMATSEFFFLIIIWQLGPGIASGHYGSGRRVLARSVDPIVDTRHMLILCYIPDQQHWYQHLGFGFEKIQKSRRKLNTYGQLKHRINCDQDQHWWNFRYSDLFENFSTGYSFLITSKQNSQQHHSNMASVYEWNQLASCSKTDKKLWSFTDQRDLGGKMMNQICPQFALCTQEYCWSV
jgi:hypothetical protein